MSQGTGHYRVKIIYGHFYMKMAFDNIETKYQSLIHSGTSSVTTVYLVFTRYLILIMVQWLTLLLCIWEVPGSNLGLGSSD
jgi:hypothetical protein